MNSKKFYILLLSILLSSLLITAQGVVQESFEYSVGATLDNSTSTLGSGFGGTWYLESGTESLSSVTTGNISYDDMDYEIPYKGNELTVSLPGAWTASRYFRTLSETWPKTTGNTYWVSFIFQAGLEAGESLTDNTYYLFKWFHMEIGVDTTEILAIGNSGGGTVYSCGSGWASGTGDDVSDVECIGDPVWLVTKMVITDADTAATYMWINPDPSSEPSEGDADVMRYTSVPEGGITHIAIENGGEDTIDVSFDEIRMGTSFDDVSSEYETESFLVQESFEYSLETSLDSATSTSGEGFGGTWYLESGTESLSSVTTGNISYDDMDYEVPYVGNELTVSLPGAWTASRYFRTLSETWPKTTGNTYWASFIFQAGLEAGESLTDNTYYLFKWFHMEIGVDTTEILAIGNSGGGTVYSCGSGWASGTGDDVSDVECIGDPVWLVTKMVITDADTAATYMWINPDPSSEPSEGDADVMRYTSVPEGGITHIAIENGGEDTIDVSFDEIRMGLSFDDVANSSYVGIEEELLSSAVPTSFVLAQNYPNPFNPTTTITYSIAEAGEVSLKVYDILGREVAELINNQLKSAGTYQLTFNAADLPSGVYFYRIQSGNTAITKKMMLLK